MTAVLEGVSGQQHDPAALYPGKDAVPILQEAGWAPGPTCTGGKSRPHRDSIPDRPASSQSLYRLSYPAHVHTHTHTEVCVFVCVFSPLFLQELYVSSTNFAQR